MGVYSSSAAVTQNGSPPPPDRLSQDKVWLHASVLGSNEELNATHVAAWTSGKGSVLRRRNLLTDSLIV